MVVPAVAIAANLVPWRLEKAEYKLAIGMSGVYLAVMAAVPGRLRLVNFYTALAALTVSAAVGIRHLTGRGSDALLAAGILFAAQAAGLALLSARLTVESPRPCWLLARPGPATLGVLLENAGRLMSVQGLPSGWPPPRLSGLKELLPASSAALPMAQSKRERKPDLDGPSQSLLGGSVVRGPGRCPRWLALSFHNGRAARSLVAAASMLLSLCGLGIVFGGAPAASRLWVLVLLRLAPEPRNCGSSVPCTARDDMGPRGQAPAQRPALILLLTAKGVHHGMADFSDHRGCRGRRSFLGEEAFPQRD